MKLSHTALDNILVDKAYWLSQFDAKNWQSSNGLIMKVGLLKIFE